MPTRPAKEARKRTRKRKRRRRRRRRIDCDAFVSTSVSNRWRYISRGGTGTLYTSFVWYPFHFLLRFLVTAGTVIHVFSLVVPPRFLPLLLFLVTNRHYCCRLFFDILPISFLFFSSSSPPHFCISLSGVSPNRVRILSHALDPIRSPRGAVDTKPSVFEALAAATSHAPASTSRSSCPVTHPQYPTNTERCFSCSGDTAAKSETCHSPGNTSEVAPSRGTRESATRHRLPFSVPIGPPIDTRRSANTLWCASA
mmetsp:Transcript_6770/g.25583  ORF Transcript_6770/g.25583 Transcript_6770/m.25583 type:complete len:254 (+) Transcript_6770:517-1278(+)